MKLRTVDMYKCTRCNREFEVCQGDQKEPVVLGLSGKSFKKGDKYGINVYVDFCPECTTLFLKFMNL